MQSYICTFARVCSVHTAIILCHTHSNAHTHGKWNFSLLLLMWLDESAAMNVHETNRNQITLYASRMIVEHQPQKRKHNVKVCMVRCSICSNTKIKKDEHSMCGWVGVSANMECNFTLHSILCIAMVCNGFFLHLMLLLVSVAIGLHTFLPSVLSSIFSCWCSNGSSVYSPNIHFVSVKPNRLNVRCIELFQAKKSHGYVAEWAEMWLIFSTLLDWPIWQ